MAKVERGVWELISQRREERKKEEERKRDREEKRRKRRLQESERKRDSAVTLILPMFEDLRAKADGIAELPEDRRRVIFKPSSDNSPDAEVALVWGDKLELTEEEERILRDFTEVRGDRGKYAAVKPMSLPRRKAVRERVLEELGLPRSITLYDHFKISATIRPYYNDLIIQGDHRSEDSDFDIDDFIARQEIIIPALDQALENPSYQVSVLSLRLNDKRQPYYYRLDD